MTVQFFEKLDFLMNISNTTNSALALNIKLDPSHISRLRRGERNALKNEVCINAMSAYFARHCEQDYQQKALSEALDLSVLPPDESSLSEHISKWLSESGKTDSTSFESFVSDVVKTKNRRITPPFAASCNASSTNSKNDIDVFYGIAGKRRAAIEVLSDILENGKPQTLLLFSDEPTDWMSDDREFIMQWGFLMSQFLSEGGIIKIIHTVSRNLDEMMRAINQWLPLYMTGSIEPYYYPRKRDGIFKRTLFVAPNISAIISTSVGNTIDTAANIVFRDKNAVASFEKEWQEYLSLCKPLMRIFTAKDEKTHFETLIDFEYEQRDSIIKTESLSLLTMPASVAASIVSRSTGITPDFNKNQGKRVELFNRIVQTHSFTEIISLHDVETVINGGMKVSLSDILSSDTVFYTVEEYAKHLENLVNLLDTYENFHVKFIANETEDNNMVYVKEDFGVLVWKPTMPPVILAIDESNMTAAFWDYLISIIGSESSVPQGRNENRKKLTAYIDRLKESSVLTRAVSEVQ